MTYAEWIELAARKVKEHLEDGGAQDVKIDRSNVLWAASILETRRALVWYGEKLYMINYNTNTEAATVDTYAREE